MQPISMSDHIHQKSEYIARDHGFKNLPSQEDWLSAVARPQTVRQFPISHWKRKKNQEIHEQKRLAR